MYTGRELDGVFDSGYAAGYADGVTRRKSAHDADQQWRQDLEDIRRAHDADPERVRELADAVEEGSDAVRRLAERWGVRYDDDVMDVAPDDNDRAERNFDLVQRMVDAVEAGPEAFAALAAEWGVPLDVLRKTPLDDVLDVVESAQLVAEVEQWLREQGE